MLLFIACISEAGRPVTLYIINLETITDIIKHIPGTKVSRHVFPPFSSLTIYLCVRTQPLRSNESSEKTSSEGSTLSVSARCESIDPVCWGGSGQWEKEDRESENGISEGIEFVGGRSGYLLLRGGGLGVEAFLGLEANDGRQS